jgi:hypothetical protein
LIPPDVRDLVRRRAEDRCEYCLLPQRHSRLIHHIEHVIARQHAGTDSADNLALSCHRCNLRKGPNIAGKDPESGQIVPLFHPRRDLWKQHFHLDGCRILSPTPTGRATIAVLALNDARHLALRAELINRGELL